MLNLEELEQEAEGHASALYKILSQVVRNDVITERMRVKIEGTVVGNTYGPYPSMGTLEVSATYTKYGNNFVYKAAQYISTALSEVSSNWGMNFSSCLFERASITVWLGNTCLGTMPLFHADYPRLFWSDEQLELMEEEGLID